MKSILQWTRVVARILVSCWVTPGTPLVLPRVGRTMERSGLVVKASDSSLVEGA